ncbi:alcohol dehydrogenase catalytic domain-containing protein [Streptomyces sp. A3M-1-3]|uniref:alcohol dehydrogenase catalytic domain-containing protein n=1 Tax=Streptomyces sp. A3M-1-3 TaxID=2962044 RepID=UPI0020B69A3B|nr:alcohol dehydrogenase catalytic domain-containing protein [Streptomyces sp. A3M-1-3]MCP3821448.1 alcohol dehydrogenase catalytic domain-containing protein [Streptomyces sp. A3M-1-3]
MRLRGTRPTRRGLQVACDTAARLRPCGQSGLQGSVADLVPGPGRLLIDVRAAGVQVAESALFRGESFGWHQPSALPHVPGSEVAGDVIAVGSGVEEIWVGRRVVASLEGGGGYAELAVADAGAAHPVPDGLGYAVAVAMLTTGASALGVLPVAALTPDGTVFVMSAAGGMCALFVQAALRVGAKVVGAAGEEKTRLVSGLGADTVVDTPPTGGPKACAARSVSASSSTASGGFSRPPNGDGPIAVRTRCPCGRCGA